MKKYERPEIKEEIILLEDIIMVSNNGKLENQDPFRVSDMFGGSN